MLDHRENFKVGVLKTCAERGMTLEETHEAVKSAMLRLEGNRRSDALDEPQTKEAGTFKDVITLGGLIPSLMRPAGDIASWAGKTLGTGLILAPIGLGAAGGYLAGRSRGKLSDEDIAEVKKRELITQYNQVAEETIRKSRVSAGQRKRRSTPVRSLV